MKSPLLLALACLIYRVSGGQSPVVETTSGQLHGSNANGVVSFMGVRFAQAPIGQLRWKPPAPFVSTSAQNTTVLSPGCIQQFAFATSEATQSLFNDPPPASEDEDCLFLNIWAPSTNTTVKKPVLFYIYGGGFNFGTASVPMFDGTSLAANQDIVVVTINYRLNVFGFPSSEDLPLAQNNLGILDQEMALQWVQQNIGHFGGDSSKVTIMGQSAGGLSVGQAIVRDRIDTPFRAGVLLSGAPTASSPALSFASFDAFATEFGCSQNPGEERLDCLRQVPASTIRNFTNGPQGGVFGTLVDNATIFANPLERLRAGNTAKVPIMLGELKDDASFFVVGMTNLTAFLDGMFPGSNIDADFVRSLYPGQNDTQIIQDAFRDWAGRCPDKLWSEAMTGVGQSSVFRYTYGAVFADLQRFPGAGAWHSSELPLLFGTFNTSTATPEEVTWSKTFQTAVANFVKNPDISPATNWPKYVSGAKTFAKLAYDGNFEPGNFVDAVVTDSLDAPCDALWEKFLV
ncbi:Carboxylesterase [Mycena crocata]|nr:Carboxylesterase [Mycena crocata]